MESLFSDRGELGFDFKAISCVNDIMNFTYFEQEQDEYSQLVDWEGEDDLPPHWVESDYLLEELPEEIYYIASFRGDDEVATFTVTEEMGEHINDALQRSILNQQIQISKKDTGNLQALFNFANQYQLVPYSYKASPAIASSMSGGSFYPIELGDPPLRMANLTRKTGTSDLGVAGKVGFLQRVIPHIPWGSPGYHLWNALTVLAMCALDVKEDGLSPILHESEGGNGGMPPYGQVASVVSCHYNKLRRSLAVTAAIASEATDILQGKASVVGSIYAGLTKFAQTALESFKAYKMALKDASDFGFSKLELCDLLGRHFQSLIPPEVQNTALTIVNTDLCNCISNWMACSTWDAAN